MNFNKQFVAYQIIGVDASFLVYTKMEPSPLLPCLGKMTRFIVNKSFIVLVFIGLLAGCVHDRRLFFPMVATEGRPSGKYDDYVSFLENNIALKEMKYSKEYVHFEFLVDTDNGSTRIQNLINIIAGRVVTEANFLKRDDERSSIEAICNYIITEFTYTNEPSKWMNPCEIIKQKKGDCKNLSILLLSMLLAVDIDAHAAISNSHMWVNVYLNGKMFIIEIDQDPERNKIYSIEGFYKNPLYKIYKNYSLKRKTKRG